MKKLSKSKERGGYCFDEVFEEKEKRKSRKPKKKSRIKRKRRKNISKAI